MRDHRPARTRRLRAAAAPVAALLALGLAACTGTDDEAAPTPSGTPSVSVTAVPSHGPLDAAQACAAMYLTGDAPLERRVGQAIVGVSGGLTDETASNAYDVDQDLAQLQGRVPEEFSAALDKVRVPFTQLRTAIDAGTQQDVQLDVASTTEGLKEYRALC
ncbi:hypothetical protein DNL40_15050 [Xylanimonas oleitrophica]|uniref:Lipoprotein n=1 Tax=Xylanimonas oleitrophica TaxID=2607479 RepID=A0A2W5Y2H1_9MICO|nr:hypothetical protein [Xylanimonas oleitrophica]PZR51784.1 hypothetical protein DNL40_15050 [Xylanimonas oleitrophica]